MYFSDVIRGLLRRWYVLLIGFVLAGACAYVVFETVPVRFEANASMLLLPPDETVALQQQGSNPYLLLGGLEQALAVLTTRLNSQEVHEDFLPSAGEYGVSGDTTSGAAFLLITAQADSEQNALDLLAEVQDASEQQLTAMQEELGIVAPSSIVLMHVSADGTATALSSTRMQLALAVVGAGIVLTVIGAAAIEGLAATRVRRRAAQDVPPPRERRLREPMQASEMLQTFDTPRLVRRTKRTRPRMPEADEIPADERL